MIRRLSCAILFTLVATSTQAATLVYNVTGYTMNEGERVQFAALEFGDGVITRLYSNDLEARASKAEERIDGNGAILLPGLIDAHGHVTALGRGLSAVNLVGSTSAADAAARVRAFLADNGNQEWVRGHGWNQVLWPGKQFPHRSSLDALAGKQAVALTRIDGHAMWVNSTALKLADIGPETPDPDGGQIIRDDTGRATGVLIDNAMNLVKAVMPPITDEDMANFALTAMQALASQGITSVHDAGITAQEVRAYQALRRENRMPIRVYAMLKMVDPAIDQYLQQGPLIDEQHMLDIRSVKISADGALGSRGAALFEDYSDMPGQRGLLLVNDEQLDRYMDRSMAAGYQVNVHAIGDKANARVLDFLEQMIARHDNRHLRHRNEHSQIVRLEDISRFAEIGVVASIQPTHATSDKNMAGDRVGEARLAGAYAWRKLLDSGARLAGGSDFPVESINPFYGIHAAVTRQDHQNQPPGGWLPGERLLRNEALSLFTEWAAWAAHQETVIGRLLPGYAADFILVSDDMFTMPAEDLWRNQVLGTWVAGRKVH
ncbi:MAG: amidohydrolase [Halieaceae bacterium]|nr:amidohydrolase [Halieaceae bacterium]